MKRSAFLRVMAASLVLSSVNATRETQAATQTTSTTDNALEYMALDAAITALNRFAATRDVTFWPFIYSRLGEAGMDTRWPTAERVGARFYELRNELITRANALNPTRTPLPPISPSP